MTKEKAALPGGKTAYLARLCIAIDLISDAVESVKRACLPKNSELKEEGRSDLAVGNPGAMTSRYVALIPLVTYLAVMWGVD